MAATRSQSMDDLRVPASTWAGEIQAYERDKRRAVDEGFVNNRQVRVTGPQVRLQERVFDPVLQRYRSNETELHQRTLEEKERVAHLNRAYDISILRGQPFNLLTHESKLETLAPGADPMRMGHEKPRNKEAGMPYKMPDTSLDYNIVSNVPHEHHHWSRPEARPFIANKEPRDRVIPAHQVKDFHIITNRYLDGHHERVARDKQLNLLEAAKKCAKVNRFDPLIQLFNDPREEERARTVDDAREVEITMRAENQQPPAYRGRQSQFYDVVSHQIHDPHVINFYDQHEAERKARYKNRYIVEHNFHKQDIKGDHINEARKLAKVAPERYSGDAERGYDLVTNQAYGRLHHQKNLHQPITMPRQTPWEKIEASRGVDVTSLNAARDVDHLQPMHDMYWGRDESKQQQTMAQSASAPAIAAPSSRRSGSRRSRASGAGAERLVMDAGKTPAPRRTPSEAPAARPRSPAAMSAASSRRPEKATVLAEARVPSERGGRSEASRSQPLLRSESHGATALGPTMRRPTPAPAPSAPVSMRAAPPAPNIPGSPGMGSVYSRPSRR